MFLQHLRVVLVRLKRNDSTGLPYSLCKGDCVDSNVRAHVCNSVSQSYLFHEVSPHLRLVLFCDTTNAWRNQQLVRAVNYSLKTTAAQHMNCAVVDWTHTSPQPAEVFET